MAKKITRGITGIKDINRQDFDTNNVNDLLSDGQYNYIHRKKGKAEEYHNLTDNIKTISSDNTDLLTVTNNNKTNNTATLHPKHDAQKEQVLESERVTITINHGTNGTPEKTKVDTNPEKVLEHSNLLTDYGIKKTTTGNTTKLGLEYTKVEDNFDLNNLDNGCVRSGRFVNAPKLNTLYFVSAYTEGNYTIQEATSLVDTSDNNKNTTYRRTKQNGVWSGWREQVGDKSTLDSLLAQKQNTIQGSMSIGITNGNWLRQVFYYRKVYNVSGGVLKTHVKSIAPNTNVEINHDEYNFSLQINRGAGTLTFTLEEVDVPRFQKVLGSSNTANISGCIFTLSGSTLTVSTTNNTDKNYIITYSDILD